MITELTQQQIVQAITSADNVQQAIDNLYRRVFKMFDDLDSMQGYPQISAETADYIYRAGSGKFGAAFMVGWINRGFQIGNVPNWQADITQCKLRWSKKMKPDIPAGVFNPAVRIRFADHLDSRVVTPLAVPEGGDDET